ncbi:MAG: replication protein [Patescibacteria group bacterium]|jgi:phage replication O-like protein O
MENETKNSNDKERFLKLRYGLYDWFMSNRFREPKSKVFFAIVRLTDGWNKSEAIINERQLAKITKINSRNVGRYLKYMLNKRILFRRDSGKKKYGKTMYFYKINSHIRHPKDGSEENHHSEDGNTAIPLTAKTAISEMAIKDIKEIKNKAVQESMDKLKNYKKGYLDEQ